MKSIFTLPTPTEEQPINYAVGVLKAKEYKPGEENHNKGYLKTEEGTNINALLIKDARYFYNEREDIDFSKPNFYVVYPRTDKNSLKLSVLVKNLRGTNISDNDSGKFFISGYMVYNEPEKGIVAFRINPNKKNDKSKPEVSFKAFALQCRGNLPKEGLGKLWIVNALWENGYLIIVDAKCINVTIPGYKESRKHSKKITSSTNKTSDDTKGNDEVGMKVLRRPNG